ncbi:MAG: aryl-sulfate sulfotransferase [Atopobiaceae bacterium]
MQSLMPTVSFAQDWSISISSIGIEESPYKTSQALGGYSKGTITYVNSAHTDSVFALVNVVLRQDGVDALDMASAQLTIEGTTYSPVTSVHKTTESTLGIQKETLTDVSIPSLAGFHNLPDFDSSSSNVITMSTRGTLLFEIPRDKADNSDGWIISIDGATSEPFDSSDKSIDFQENLIAAQKSIDTYLRESYASDKRTIDDPKVFLNPYRRAPLTALVMFESDSESEVSVVIKGKTSDCDVSYTVTGASTHHEVPIYGLYPDTENSVEISCDGKTSTIHIKTDPLPSEIETVTRESGSGQDQQAGQLFIAQSPHTIAFDNQGDIRWYITDIATDSAYGFQLTDNDSKITYFRNVVTNNIFQDVGNELVQMDWLGKVDKLISNPDMQSDHDSCVVDDNTVLYITAGMVNDAKIMRLDLTTGDVTPWLVMSDVLDVSLDPSYPDWNDLWHLNTVRYYKDAEHGDYVLVSVRNQSLVLKIRWTGSQATADDIEWALSPIGTRPESEQPEALKGKFISPNTADQNFEWFYDQHDCNMVSYDGSTMTVALFDNGIIRNNVGEPTNPDKYSRGVIYAVDENSLTARQVYSYGKDVNDARDLYSEVRGSSRQLSYGEGEHVVTCFPVYKGSWNNSIVVETDQSNNVVARYRYSSNICGIYRAQTVSPSTQEGMFTNYSVAQGSGDELHRYHQTFWSKTSFQSAGAKGLTSVSLTRDDDSVTVLGNLPDASDVSEMELIADNGDSAYSFGIPSTANGGVYGKCVPVSTLPDGSYHIYMRATSRQGAVTTYSFDKVLRVGANQPAGVQVEEQLRDNTPENALEGYISAAQEHDFEDMQIVVDPFGTSPLTALALFKTDDVCSVSVVAHGKSSSEDVSYDVHDAGVVHLVPIVGLYSDDVTDVDITVTFEDGSKSTQTRQVTTAGVPAEASLPVIEVATAEGVSAEDLAPGLTFCAPVGNCYYAVDHTGAIRWYLPKTTNHGVAGVNFTSDNHLLIVDAGDVSSASTNGYVIRELDLLGREYRHIVINNSSVHHEVKELDNGDLLVGITDTTKNTINDGFVIIDKNTGEEKLRCNFDEVLCDKYGVEKVQDTIWGASHSVDEDGSEYDNNWLHNNALFYVNGGTDTLDDDYVIISSRHRSMVLKLYVKSQEVAWVIGDHTGLENTGLASKLLTPTDGLAWQYAQHAPMVMKNGDILLFDNGCHRTKDAEVSPAVNASENYSRLVQYHVDESSMTVSEVRSFGENDSDWSLFTDETAHDHYCTYIGDADELENGSWLGTFGGHVIDNKGNVSDSIPAAYMGGKNTGTLVEVDEQGKLVWQFNTRPKTVGAAGIYRAARKEITELNGYYDASGSLWIGNAGDDTQVQDVDLSSYEEGAVGVEGDVTITNYGQRFTIMGTLADATDVERLYVVCDGKAYRAALNGTQFTASFGISQDKLFFAHTLSLACVRSDEHVLEQLDESIVPAHIFALTPSGENALTEGRALSVGDTAQLNAAGSPGLSSRTLSFESSNPDVAQVDSQGLVQALTPGISVITYADTFTGLRCQSVVTVTGRSLNKAQLSMKVGDTSKLSLTTLGDKGNEHEIAWASSDKTIVSVNADGEVTALNPGDVTIACYVDGVQYSCNIHVVPNIEEGVYTIASRLDTNLVLDVQSGSQSNGANVQIWENNQTRAQLFRISYVADGKYALRPLCSDAAVDVSGASAEEGANIQQYEWNGTNAQLWDIVDNSDGSYTFVNAVSGKALDVAWGNAQWGANVQTWTKNGTNAQKFELIKYFSPGVYVISPAQSKRFAMDVNGGGQGDGENIQLYSTNRSYAQKFLIRYVRDGAYSIMALNSGKYLDVSNGSHDSGANIQQWTWNGSAAQLWRLERIGDNTFRFVNAGSHKALDVSEGRFAEGSNIHQWEINGTLAQSFKLTCVSRVATISPHEAQHYALDVSGGSVASGTNVQLFERNGTDAQRFYITNAGREGSRAIISVMANNSLDVAGGNVTDGTNVQMYEHNGTLAQRWFIQYLGIRDGSSVYRILGDSSRKALDISGGVFSSGRNVQIWGWNNSAAQIWNITYEK